MEMKKLSIELPKGGMNDLTKQVRNNPIIEPSAYVTGLGTWGMRLVIQRCETGD